MNVPILASSVPCITNGLQCGHCGDLPEESVGTLARWPSERWHPCPLSNHPSSLFSDVWIKELVPETKFNKTSPKPTAAHIHLKKQPAVIIKHPLSFTYSCMWQMGLCLTSLYDSWLLLFFYTPVWCWNIFSHAPVWKLGSPSLKGPCVTVGCPAPWSQMQLMMLKKWN